jgi:hypothetical protein
MHAWPVGQLLFEAQPPIASPPPVSAPESAALPESLFTPALESLPPLSLLPVSATLESIPPPDESTVASPPGPESIALPPPSCASCGESTEPSDRGPLPLSLPLLPQPSISVAAASAANTRRLVREVLIMLLDARPAGWTRGANFQRSHRRAQLAIVNGCAPTTS